jgi:hypothetical protein
MEEAQAYQFSWTGQNGKKLNYKIEVTYSTHCYSEKMEMVPPLGSGQKYYIFFNLRQKASDRGSTDPYWLSMFIESAYAKNQPVGTAESRPFGRLAEEIVSSNRAT